MSELPHLDFIINTGAILKTANGHDIEIWELKEVTDEAILSSWAKHFRQQYCSDSDIDLLISGTPYKTKKDYLNEVIFPDKSRAPGPSIRSGDFTEILLTDFLEFIWEFWVPRGKYEEKWNRNESIKGVDILGLQMKDVNQHNPEDVLITIEAKAQLSSTRYNNTLQNAINDSSKDILRQAQTLNAIKRRLLSSNDIQKVMLVERFQDKADRPFTYKPCAIAVLNDIAFDESLIRLSDSSNHSNLSALKIIIFKGNDLMNFTHQLYERAANEA
ncbi:DUF1837 domain-containing protein [Acinetobacter sp. ACIN00229]|uniref:Hachiman antiphage defense system protein HamA n=1 Tax=Acinetobacter sp. ACIN00229 TaxID=2792607 RepID=UPI0018DFDDEC|nr:Hachiman antiphage defense system protein HamA [Acinetobacter sp. ACIN00229]MBI0424821.1 DUF1837 domain-containing protein [Acinetobacter sp. ACIN00229]